MTLDVLHFIDYKGGNPEEIRESQKKRGLSTDIVDEIKEMYAAWVKREPYFTPLIYPTYCFIVDFEVNRLSKEVNAVQKEIGAKKKVSDLVCYSIYVNNFDDLG